MTKSRDILTAGVLALAIPVAAFSQSATPVDPDTGIEGRLVSEALFETMDTAGHGEIHFGDVEQFRKDIFASMDTNEDSKVNYEEFRSWDPGFANVADDVGRGDAYVTASKIVFAFWDRNGDGALHTGEMRTSLSADFRRADLNDNAFLSKDEFIQSFPIIVAMRAAIRPDL